MTIQLASDLIKLASVTPDDAGCQQLLAKRLEQSGCKATHLQFDDVDNLWLTHGEGEPVLVFLGHTDVVPTGPTEEWLSPPFAPEIRNGFLYGRGAADMKGSIAAMATAFERFIATNPNHKGTLAMLLTSDEEGPAINGTLKVMEYLQQQNVQIKWCVVGEPSSQAALADVIKNGRRGSLTAHATIYGTQGHVAYPQLAENPIHLAIPVLSELCAVVWDNGNDHYPPTSFQVSNIRSGTGADNVIPGKLELQLNFRYSTEVTEEVLINTVREYFEQANLRFDINWLPSSKPFLTSEGALLSVAQQVIKEQTGKSPQLSTAGGTSDGRFIAPTGAEVVELGPVNDTIHKVNECVNVEDLEVLSIMYENIISQLLAN